MVLVDGQNRESHLEGAGWPANSSLHTKLLTCSCMSGTRRTPASTSSFILASTRLSVGKQLASICNTCTQTFTRTWGHTAHMVKHESQSCGQQLGEWHEVKWGKVIKVKILQITYDRFKGQITADRQWNAVADVRRWDREWTPVNNVVSAMNAQEMLVLRPRAGQCKEMRSRTHDYHTTECYTWQDLHTSATGVQSWRRGSETSLPQSTVGWRNDKDMVHAFELPSVLWHCCSSHKSGIWHVQNLYVHNSTPNSGYHHFRLVQQTSVKCWHTESGTELWVDWSTTTAC